MASANPPESSLTVGVTDITATGLPRTGFNQEHPRFYVKLIVDGDMKTTSRTTRGLSSWEESFCFNVSPSSILELHLYAHHRVRPQLYIGGTKNRIDYLLSQEITSFFQKLYVDHPQGVPHSTDVSVEFTISQIMGNVEAA
ncbi:hypothetical protein BV22DRAFT_1033810 [Leucogyrophana mollusca]|uniref:Uncharacterized protein n=1 Tax=Leucogyrophana mollusca TaxID=85980 RepID=A0ACB8BJ79_9AGAM|nr:hypothetical protein BV22DRAFT_1033810 [Leucogyrophana mollusca]